MRFAIRKMLVLATALCAVHLPLHAQNNAGDYPNKPIRWLVGFAPGASNDIIARLIAARLSEAFGQQVLVDNRGGAGGVIAGEIVAKSAPDGYTLIMSTTGPSVTGPLLSKRAPYQVEDFTQVVTIGYTPMIIVGHPSFPARNSRELVDYAKANPGKITWGSSGVGGSPHFALLIFQAATGIEVTHVPYKGTAPALTDVAAGQIQAMHASVISAEAHLVAKRLKIIGVGSTKRLASIPEAPTFAENGIVNGESQVWFGVALPLSAPRPIVMKLNTAVNRVLQSPEAIKRMQDLGLEVVGGTPESAEAFVKREAATVRQLIKLGKIRPE
jgi:tripartite-type tricarboxylate transporter receptor subunit TctC